MPRGANVCLDFSIAQSRPSGLGKPRSFVAAIVTSVRVELRPHTPRRPEFRLTRLPVHAKTDAAKRFYLRCPEFSEYLQDNRILFLPFETVVASFG